MTMEERARARESVVIAATPAEEGVFQGVRVSWGGVWSGFLVGIGVLMLLGTLGLAVGVTTADLRPDVPPDVQGLDLAAGTWVFVSLLIALFVGGMVASRMGMVFDRATGMIQGTLVWVLAMLAMLYLGATGMGFGASALFGATRTFAPGVATPPDVAGAITNATATSWATFGAMVVSLMAAILGAIARSGRAAARVIE